MDLKTHVLITGRVQGVWFRASTKQKADQLGLRGWVRNTREGHVEAVFEGEEKIVNEMLEWCKKGPPLARVDDVKIRKETSSNEFVDFSVRY